MGNAACMCRCVLLRTDFFCLVGFLPAPAASPRPVTAWTFIYTHTNTHTQTKKKKKKGMIVIQKMLSFLFTFFPVSSLSFRSSPLTRFLVARIAFSRPQISVLYRARAAKAGRQGKQQQQEYRKLETKDKGKSRVASSSCYCVSCKSDDFYKLHKRKEGFCV
jgi:hypothetical protein